MCDTNYGRKGGGGCVVFNDGEYHSKIFFDVVSFLSFNQKTMACLGIEIEPVQEEYEAIEAYHTRYHVQSTWFNRVLCCGVPLIPRSFWRLVLMLGVLVCLFMAVPVFLLLNIEKKEDRAFFVGIVTMVCWVHPAFLGTVLVLSIVIHMILWGCCSSKKVKME